MNGSWWRALPGIALGIALAAGLPPGARAEDGADAAVGRLAEAIRFPTVSHQDPAQRQRDVFLGFHEFLARSFPRVHAELEREVVAGLSLLYTWPGRDASRAPILLTSHFDVVPVVPETLDDWEHSPFEGVVAGGFVWGRGAIDDKAGVLATLEAVEGLLAEGFVPAQTVYLAFGHDEEIGGDEGAAGIAKLLRERGVRLVFSLDEGLVVTEGIVPGVTQPVALVGIAEKGYVTLRITAHAAGGHSSRPTGDSAIGKLAAAITALEANPMPARVDGPAAQMLDAIAPHASFPLGFVLGNRALFGPLVTSRLAADPSSNALIRTTTAVTMLEAGVKENVLPPTASAIVNFRLVPGDTVRQVEEHVRSVVGPEIAIETIRGDEASKVADAGSPSFAVVRRSIEAVFPDALVVPGLVLGGTDTKHYGQVAEQAYRFAPMRARPEDVPRAHGTNERIAVANYAEMIRFYATLLREAER
jgi:carboxypeptidase PM20D1